MKPKWLPQSNKLNNDSGLWLNYISGLYCLMQGDPYPVANQGLRQCHKQNSQYKQAIPRNLISLRANSVSLVYVILGRTVVRIKKT